MTHPIFRAILFVTLALLSPAAAQSPNAQQPKITPAMDGIFAAFATHPLVGIDDDHGQAQQLDFYAALVRDPRFAREIGNLVVETGSANNQAIIDAYVAGEAVPYTELRKVWTDPAGWYEPPALLGVANLFATVRAVNVGLPAGQRIRVWLGQAPIDWSRMNTPADFRPYQQLDDGYVAELILHEILAKNKKALVLYGGQHFVPRRPGTPADQHDQLVDALQRGRPGALFVITPFNGGYMGNGRNLGMANRTCLDNFARRHFAGGPTLALAAPLKDGALEAEMRACPFELPADFPLPLLPPTMPAELQATIRANMIANLKYVYLGLFADALLWLGPPGGFTTSPALPDYYLDPEYRRELDRRQQIRGQKPRTILDPASNPASPQPR